VEQQYKLYSAYLTSLGKSKPTHATAECHSQPLYRHFIKYFFPKSKTAKIIELGCGSGFLLKQAADSGYTDLLGIDLSIEQVQLAQQLNIPYVKHANVIEELQKTQPNSIDFIVSIDLVEHLDLGTCQTLSELVHTVLKPNGQWLIQTVNGVSPFYGRIRYGDITHLFTYTPRSISQCLRLAGFRHFQFYESAPIVHSIKSIVRFLLWKCLRLFYMLMIMIETGMKESILTQNMVVIVKKSAL